MSLKHTLIKGTFLLTAAGMISRLIGFYYRIFLTHTFGAEGIGIYQLIFPVYALCFSLTSAGIQTTISRLVAANDTPTRKNTQYLVYRLGLLMSLGLAVLISGVVYTHADRIALFVLHERRCANLLRILACTIPLGAIHNAVSGYYYGIKNAAIPSITQLAEQLVKVLSVYLMVVVLTEKHRQAGIELAVWGMVFGEGVSSLLSVTALLYRKEKLKITSQNTPARRTLVSLIIRQSVPLSANRLVLNFLQSAEAVLIPAMLRQYGLSSGNALSIYGILTGMAMPLVMFPSAITNSVSVMLLPAIANAQAEENTSAVQNAIEQATKYCLLLGIYCTGVFVSLGKDMGPLLFKNAQSGEFIVTLAWICPFLYLNATLGSIVHGLGRTFLYFLFNCISLCIRIGCVIFIVPKIGILGYLWGILGSMLCLTLLLLLCLGRECHYRLSFAEYIVLPLVFIGCSLICCYFMSPLWKMIPNPILVLLAKGCFITLLYGLFALYSHAYPGLSPIRNVRR